MSREQAGLFEPEQAGPPPPPTAPAPAGPRHPTWLLLAPALTLAVGAVLGFALGTTQAHRQPTSPAPTSSTPAPTTRPATPPATKLVVRNYASPACMETAQRADRLIELLIRNQRTDVERLLVAYTVAARQCRQDSSPPP
jgi:hypothetical protein